MKNQNNIIKTGLYLMVLLSVVSFGTSTLVVFDNLGTGNYYQITSYQSISCLYQNPYWYRSFYAMSFVSEKTVLFDKVELALTLNTGNNNADIILMNDNGGLPGGTLESIHKTSIPASSTVLQPVVSAVSVLKPQLQAGTTYWIAVAPGPDQHVYLDWHYNTLGYSGPAATNYTRNNQWIVPWVSRTSSCAFRVTGSFSGCARPRSDLNNDCRVNLEDLAIFASDWLECGFENPLDC